MDRRCWNLPIFAIQDGRHLIIFFEKFFCVFCEVVAHLILLRVRVIGPKSPPGRLGPKGAFHRVLGHPCYALGAFPLMSMLRILGLICGLGGLICSERYVWLSEPSSGVAAMVATQRPNGATGDRAEVAASAHLRCN